MSESTRSELNSPTKFDNLVLKQWLLDKGEAGRREVLTKLKTDLQELGLSRSQVRRGLLQLATKPRVILRRHAYRRPKSLEKYEKPIDDKTEAAFLDRLELHDENTQTPDSTQRISEEDTRRDETLKAETEISTSSESMLSKSCELGHRTVMPHSFDEALEKMDCIFSAKTNIVNMNTKRSSVIISAADAFKSQNKNDAMNNNVVKKSTCSKDTPQFPVINGEKTRTEEVSDLTREMVGQEIVYRTNRSEKIHIKLNLKSSNKKINSYAKSDVHKESDTVTKCSRVQVDCVSNQNKRSKQDDDVTTDSKATKIEDNLNKRQLYDTTTASSVESKRKKIRASADERKELDRKMAKNIKYKFRSCFGDCESISEDEQEQCILQKRCKRRRKKDSVDSCDSGVYFSEVNAVNSIEILKDIQKAVPDSTMHEDISEDSSSCRMEADVIKNITSDENDKITNNVENVTIDADNQPQNDKCNVDEVNDEIHTKSNSTCENNLVQSTTVLNSIETTSKDKTSNTDVPVLQDTKADNNVSPSSTPRSNFNRDAGVTAGPPQPATRTSDLRDLSKLLNMDFNETCQVTSNGNVLSIKEKDAIKDNQDICKKDTNEDLQLTIANCNQSTDQQALETVNGSSSTDSCLDVRKDVTAIPVRINLCNLLGDTNEVTLPEVKLDGTIEQKDKVSLPNSESNKLVEKEANIESECNVVAEEKKETGMSDSKEESQNTQPRNVPRIKLRVLSSAELGSRWCPTPVNAVISTTSELSSTNTVVTSDTGLTYTTSNQVSSSSVTTQAVPMTIPVILTANVLNSGDNSSNNLKKSSMDPKFSEAIYNGLVHIYRLIVSIRATRVDHSKILLKEFENLRKILNSEDHINLISAVIDILNKELLVNQPLTLKELLHYIPLFKTLYRQKRQEENDSNGYPDNIPTIITNMTNKHNMHNNSQGLQSATSVQNVLQKIFSSCIVQTSVSTNQKEKASVQPQNNLIQNNVPMNAAATNYGVQQPNFRTPLQTLYRHQGPPPNSYFVTQHSIPVQHTPLLVNPAETGIRFNQQVATAPFLYSYLLGANTYGNVNAANYSAQQTMTQTRGQNVRNVPCMGQSKFQNSMNRQTAYMPQEVQPQNMPQIPQNIPVINPTTQTAQNNFVSNASRSKKLLPKHTQRNETRQNVTVQMQAQVPHNVTSKQAPPPLLQQTQSQNKQKSAAQISLESTVKQFGILKYLSDIQKIMLLRQINFYFGCTTWLQQQFTTRQWQIINSQRSLLLHFQTLLKHIVQNTINSISPNVSQSNMFENSILINTENNIQKAAEKTVQGNEEIHCPVSTSNTEEQQCKIGNTDTCNVPCQRNLITLTSTDQCENGQKVTGNLPDKQLPNQARESETLQNEEVQWNKQTEQTLGQKDQSIVMSNLEPQKALDSNIKQKPEDSIESVSQQSLNNSIKIIYDVPYVVQKEVPVTSNSEEFSKNTLQQTNPDLTNEQNSSNCIKVIHNVPYTNNKEVPIISNLNVFHKDTMQQSNPHLVTVQISSHNYEVRVIDTNAVDKTEDQKIDLVPKEPKEHEELEEGKHNISVPSCLENNTCENLLEVHSPKTLDDTKHFSNEDINNGLEGITISHIADVRSITLEAFEEMEENNNTHVSNSEGNIIEEEMKVCLFCSKSSSVTCSVCLEANYCSQECLRLHWEEHYQDCKPVKNSVYL